MKKTTGTYIVLGQRLQIRILTIVTLVCLSVPLNAQLRTVLDTTTIRIGEQIRYTIEVEADSTALVVFPKGQTFAPMELVEDLDIDTVINGDRQRLLKPYKLTQFDSGAYTIPRQRVMINDREFFTDSLRVTVNTVEVDTTKQGLYDIKEIIPVQRRGSKWWIYLLAFLAIALLIFAIWWFVWRKRPLTEEEELAILSPYERAQLALQRLDDSRYLDAGELKPYYSELTFIIRRFLEEKVYDRALESTTNELIDRLEMLRDGQQVNIDRKVIENLNVILKRADLVKFAKLQPDPELAKMDRNLIAQDIDHVKAGLPEPTEEELLADMEYQEALAKKKFKRKLLITAVIVLLACAGTFSGFVAYYGFDHVRDTVLRHPNKRLLESDHWVRSEYGAPGVIITTPEVLERMDMALIRSQDSIETAAFEFGGFDRRLYIQVSSTKAQSSGSEGAFDLRQVAESNLKDLEAQGVVNVFVKNEQFITPNGQEGLKTFGTCDVPVSEDGEKLLKSNYAILGFTTQNLLQQVVLIWPYDDPYAEAIMDRVLKSIELIKLDERDQ